MNIAQVISICILGSGTIACILKKIEDYSQRKKYRGLTAIEYYSKQRFDVIKQIELDKILLMSQE